MATRHRVSSLVGLVLVGLLAGSRPGLARTLRTITVDGDLNDWSEVLLDRDHKVADRSAAQGDPDNPPQSQRDQRAAAFTWDATNLYLYFSRTGAGTNSFNALYYFDLNHDGLLSSADRLVFLKFAGSSFGGSEYRAYVDGGTPDVLGGDGQTPPGTSGVLISATGCAAAMDSNGIAVEASITWATLGVPAGSPILIHPSLTSNTNLPAGVQDNTDLLDTFLPGVLITPGTTKGSAPGRFVDFPHRVTNDGTAADVIDLIIRTRLGFSVAVYSDPNGDGSAADGALLELDANGDGDTTDTGDIPPAPLNDANGNLLVDGGALASGATRDYVLRVGVPVSQPLGTEEVLRVFVVSSYDPATRMETEDRVRVGLLTITPPRTMAAGPGQGMRLAHVACNESGSARVLDMTFTSSLGWSGTFFTDPNGDGDPSDGVALGDSDADGLPDLGSVADAECRPLVLVLQVPAGATPGTQDDLTVSVSDGASVAEVEDVVSVVGGRVDVKPDRLAKSQRGRTIFLQHDVVNAAPTSDSFTMTAGSTLGSQVAVLDDTDGDGDPDGSSVITNTGSVPGNGASVSTITRIRIPANAIHGNVDSVTTQAESDASTDFDLAIDSVTVVDLLTYSDALFARPATEFFGQCSTMYVLAYRSGGGVYRFAWYDPAGALRRASADISPYADGSLDDFYDGGAAPMLGTWTVKLQERSGGGIYTDVGPSGTGTFQMLDLVAAGARVSLNDTGADLYLLSGDPLSAFADLANPTSVDILGSRVEHVAFFDADGDGAPTAGEDYVRMDGTVAAWAAGLLTSSRSPLDVYAGEGSADRFITAPVTYPRNGAWTLETRWAASCGFLMSVRTATFIVGCQPPPTFAGVASAVDLDPCAFTGVRLSWSPVINWGLGTSGTYAVYRSTDPGFTPDATTLIAFGLTALAYTDLSAPAGVEVSYVVRAESNTTCADGPNNGGLMDANFAHVLVTDADAGLIPVADFTHSSPVCLDAGVASVDFFDASVGPPVDIEWDFDGDTVVDATGATATWTFTSAGDHPVTLTVRNPCGVDVLTRNVRVGSPPVAIIGASSLETCVSETIDFEGLASSATPPATLVAWSWDFDGDGLEDSAAADPPASGWPAMGMYRVTLRVTDSLGCVATDAVDVQVHDALTVTLGAPIVDHCTGLASVVASAAGGRAPYLFSWDVLVDDGNGVGSATFPFGTSRSATLTVTDAAGCTATATSSAIAINPQLSVSLGTPSVEPCLGFVSLRATATGGDGSYMYTWSRLSDDGNGLGTGIVPAGPHVETVTVTDGSGCTAEAQLAFDVLTSVNGSFTWTVTYLYPDQFRADLSAVATGGVAPHLFSWDINGDGSIEGSGATFSFMMGANETIPVELTITDSNSCSALVAEDVLSDGCPVDTPIQLLMVRKQGPGYLFTWQSSTHACHGRYGLLEAATAFPADRRNGTFPTDPLWSSLSSEDADGSDLDPTFSLADPRAGLTRYYLVRDGGTDGSWGPTESYGNFGVTP